MRTPLPSNTPAAFEEYDQLSEEDKAVLRRENTHRWAQPLSLYSLVVLCSMAAAVQGMDESVINGAQLFFPQQFGIATNTSVQPGLTQNEINKNEWLLGLVTGAPYVSFFIFHFPLIVCWVGTWNDHLVPSPLNPD